MTRAQSFAPAIGILGGMGPDATVELMRRVIAATPARDDCDHVHMIVDSNPHVPSRIRALVEGTGASPGPELARMAARLVRAEAGVLAIACNTAHAYIDEIRAGAGAVEVLDMIGLAARDAAARPLVRRRAGLLASSAVQRLDLYARALAAHDIGCVFPARQPVVMEIIKAVKRGGAGPDERAALADIARALIDAGADVLIIACTEISYLSDALPPELPRLDALDSLAAEIVRRGRPRRPAAETTGATGGSGA